MSSAHQCRAGRIEVARPRGPQTLLAVPFVHASPAQMGSPEVARPPDPPAPRRALRRTINVTPRGAHGIELVAGACRSAFTRSGDLASDELARALQRRTSLSA